MSSSPGHALLLVHPQGAFRPSKNGMELALGSICQLCLLLEQQACWSLQPAAPKGVMCRASHPAALASPC